MTNKELISKDSVMKLLGDHFNIYENLFIEQIGALPTFSPEAIIEEMIEDIKRNFPDNKKYTKFGEGLITGKIDSLEMLKHRLRAENIS